MKKKLTDNLALKIISLVCGILVWLVVANIDNPIIERSFTLQDVDLVNEAYIEDTGMMCVQNVKQTTVRVTLTGERLLLDSLTAEDIRLTADLQQAVSFNTDPVMIPLSASCPGIAAGKIRISPPNYAVSLEAKVTNEYLININNGESKPARGYAVGTQTVSPEKIRITGPQSVMSRIDRVVAAVNLDGASQERSDTVSLQIYDKNGDSLQSVYLSNLRLENDGKATVTTKFWRVRQNVALAADYVGTPAQGYVVNSVTTVPETISVAGTADALESLRKAGNRIYVHDKRVDVTGVSDDLEVRISLASLMPEGTRISESSSDEVLVNVCILPEGGYVFYIPTNEIRVENRSPDMQVTFEFDRIEVRVKKNTAPEEGFDTKEDFDEDAATAAIDLTGIQEGLSTVPVKIALPEGYELVEDVSTEVTARYITVVNATEP